MGQKDIARVLGVTQATVSRALSGKPGVSDEVRERILGFCEAQGYQPDFAGRGLSSGRTGVVSLIKNDMYLGEVHGPWAAMLHSALRARGLRMRLDTADDFNSILMGRSADGFIVFNHAKDFPEDIGRCMMGSDRPVVYTDCPVGACPTDCVAMDSEGGVRAAVGYLAGLGHRSIAYFGISPLTSISAARHAGFLKGLADNRIAPMDNGMVLMDGWPSDYPHTLVRAEALRACLLAGATAFVTASDLLALGVMRLAASWGYRVPDDLSVIGYDDSMVARISEVPMTSVSQNLGVASNTAAEMMAALIGGSPPRPAETITHPLVVRGTTAPPGVYRTV